MLQITVVGEAGFRIKVKSNLYVFIFHLQGFGEARQCSKRSLSKVLSLFITGQSQQCLAQLGGQNCGQRTVFRCFYAQGLDAGPFCIVSHAIQQYCLTYPSKSYHQDAFRRQPSAHTLYCHANRFPDIIPACEFRGRRTCTRGKWVCYWIHGWQQFIG